MELGTLSHVIRSYFWFMHKVRKFNNRAIYRNFCFFANSEKFYSLIGALFPLPRVIYAMASDGLLFEWMGKIHPRFHTPFLGTMVAGFFTGL